MSSSTNPIAVISKKNGKATKIYRSIAATQIDGFDPSTVSKVLKGAREQHNEHTFHAYKGNTEKLMDVMGKKEVVTVAVASSKGIKV